MTGPLAGLRILDMSRVLAAPSCTQLLGDLGADVIKIEKPGEGDDTRKWGPPYLRGRDGRETSEGAYYLAANRSKRSVTIDFTKPVGQMLARSLIGKCDVLFENYKVGTLSRYRLAWDDLKDEFPRLVYCSVTGFGQTGPYAPRAGYDYLVQAMGGFMSQTGEPDGEPMKAGVGIADLMTGMYAAVAVLSALRHRDLTGKGQHIDIALLDCQVAWLATVAQNYLTSGEVPPRLGNAHPNIVPYQVFAAADGHIVLAVGNDGQFRKFCDFAGRPELAGDPRFATNEARVRNRKTLVPLLAEIVANETSRHWIDGLERLAVPCSPINRLDQVFEDPQVVARGMTLSMPHPLAPGPIRLVNNPIKMSETSPAPSRPPPLLGQHTEEVLGELLGLDDGEVERLREAGVV